jgi:spermidine synthase
MQPARLRVTLLAVFALSGFSGLVYESVWTRYLGLFLGHSAQAQTLVLGLFMGGLAIGSLVASRRTDRWRNLLRGYAITEGAIGLLALLFHPAFLALTGFSLATVMPQLGSAAAIAAWKWSLGALLLLPQSILLGMTFPLMSASLIRRVPGRSGATLAALYFTNGLGGAAGVLVSGFVLVRAAGLPGTLAVAGAINLAVAAVAWRLAGPEPEAAFAAGPRAGGPAPAWAGTRALLALALFTGSRRSPTRSAGSGCSRWCWAPPPTPSS